MRDVAARAGVSLKTVSRVINREAGVAGETADAVERAIAELGYHADLQARGLRRGDRRSQSIGLVVSSVANPFDAELHGAIEEAAARHHVAVLALSSNDDPAAEAARAATLTQRQVDGLLIASVGTDQGYLAGVVGARPIVFVDREPSLPIGDWVVSDHQIAAQRATRHLISHGHRRIALLTDSELIQTARARRAGYLAALAEAGLTVDPVLMRGGLVNEQMGRMATHELLTGPQPPTALFAAQNHLAIGAMRALHYLRKDGQIALVSFDDVAYGDLFPVPLTAITQDPARIGQLATERLLGRIAGDITGPGQAIVVPTGFAVRGSGEIRPQIGPTVLGAGGDPAVNDALLLDRGCQVDPKTGNTGAMDGVERPVRADDAVITGRP